MSNDAHGGSRKRGAGWVALQQSTRGGLYYHHGAGRELGLEETEGQITTAALLSGKVRASWFKDSPIAALTHCCFQGWVFHCDLTEKFAPPTTTNFDLIFFFCGMSPFEAER